MLRAITQLYYLTPKAAHQPTIPKSAPCIGAIFGANILCALLHIFLARPEAGEAERGYLHGGLLIDFVGQHGPTSKIRLLAFDVLVLALQLLTLAVHLERQACKVGLTPPSSIALSNSLRAEAQESSSAVRARGLQEQGSRRSDSVEASSIELENLHSSPNHHPSSYSSVRGANDVPSSSQSISQGTADENLSSERQLEAEQQRFGHRTGLNPHPLDIFNSGQVILADFHLLHTIRSQWWISENARRPPV